VTLGNPRQHPFRTLAAALLRGAGRLLRGAAVLRGLAPYAAIEILLPGGSLIALALWFYRRHRSRVPCSTIAG
jgi:hypothetical protein